MTRILVVDTETTGLDHAGEDRVVEVAAVLLLWESGRGWRVGDSVSSLVDPGRPIPPQASAVHHLTDADVRGRPSLDQAVEYAISHFGRFDYFAAHNAPFDRGFFRPTLERLGGGVESVDWIDTLRCARHLYPSAPSHQNQVLRYYLHLQPPLPSGLFPHRALYDAVVTADVLRQMLDDGERPHSPEDLHALSTSSVLLSRVTMGKYRGRAWSEMDDGYLRWCLGPGREFGDATEDVRLTARHHLERRRRA